MEQLTANLYDCCHCGGTGTCKSGADGSSCLACAKRNEIPFWSQKGQYGLLCGSCGGLGKAEPYTDRLNKRIAPLLAIILVIALLAIIAGAAMLKSAHFAELLAFASAIIGSVSGYYFSERAK